MQSILPDLLPIDDLYTREDMETVPNQQWDKRAALPVPAAAATVTAPLSTTSNTRGSFVDDNGSPHRKRGRISSSTPRCSSTPSLSSSPSAPSSLASTIASSSSSTSTTRLATPKPDQTIGLSAESLTCYNARAQLGPVCTPVTADSDLLFPFFTAECKGDQGRLKVSRMQNAHNAAVMLRNMHCLRRKAAASAGAAASLKNTKFKPSTDDVFANENIDLEEDDNDHETDETNEAISEQKVCDQEFYSHIHAVTLSLSTESVELCYHWASPLSSQASHANSRSFGYPSADDAVIGDNITVYTKPLNTWSLSSESHEDFLTARRCVRNALDWCLERAKSWVARDLQTIEGRGSVGR